MNQLKGYIAPNNKLAINPYIMDVINSFSGKIDFINMKNPSKIGYLDLFQYLNKIDVVFLNWTENLPDRRGGIIQIIVLMFSLFICKIRGVKIVWTLHNRLSHFRKNLKLKNLLFKYLVKRSDYIITHSKDGVTYLNSIKRVRNILFIHHPIKPKVALEQNVKSIDILIWGSLIRYKGIDEFLKYLKSKNILERYKILIIGKNGYEDYLSEIVPFQSETIQIRDCIVPNNELMELFSKTRIILFTYKNNSVLSSGAIMDSIGYDIPVIGPHFAAFKDLKDEGVIFTYDNFDQLIDMLEDVKVNEHINFDKVNTFIQINGWNEFANRVIGFIT